MKQILFYTYYLLCVWKKCIDIKCHLHNCTDLKNDFSNHIIFRIFRASEIEEKFYEIIWKRKYLSKDYFISNKTNEAFIRFGILKWWHLIRPRSYFICIYVSKYLVHSNFYITNRNTMETFSTHFHNLSPFIQMWLVVLLCVNLCSQCKLPWSINIQGVFE